MPQIIFLPHEEICPEGAVIQAETGTTICDAALQNGIEIEGELLIPKEKKRIRIQLTPEKEKEIEKIIEEIKDLISQPKPPEPSRISSCSKCSYFEFCWG